MRTLPLLSVVVALSLSGCALFAPKFDPVLAEKSTSAFENVSRIAAGIELGNYTDPASFAGASDLYTEVQAELAVARLRAQTLPVSDRGTAREARDMLVGFIEGCAAQVSTRASLHRTVGLQPNSGASQPLLVACDHAAKAARAME